MGSCADIIENKSLWNALVTSSSLWALWPTNTEQELLSLGPWIYIIAKVQQ